MENSHLIDSTSILLCTDDAFSNQLGNKLRHPLRDFPLPAGEDLAKSFCSSEQVEVAPQLPSYSALTAQHLCAQVAAGSVLGLPSTQCPAGEHRRPWEDAFLAK